MSDINVSIRKTIINEGGYVNNPKDPGGRTKYGITQRDLDVTRSQFPDLPGDVALLTPDQAAQWYATTTQPERYNNPLYTNIERQDVCDKIFDMGVLFGVGTAVKCLQRALNLPVIDGVFGPATLRFVNAVDVEQGELDMYEHVLTTHAEAVVAAHPDEGIFLRGWESRVAK